MKQFLILLALLTTNALCAQNFKFGKVSKEELTEKVHPKDSSANAAVLYKNETISFSYSKSEGTFVQQRQVHERIKIYNKEGFDYATEEVYLYIGSNASKEKISNLKAYTYNLENGKITETKLSRDGVFNEDYNDFYRIQKFTMPNIKEGCIIEFRYNINSSSISIDDFTLQYNIPINKLDIRITTPEYLIYNKQSNLRAAFQPKMNTSTRTLRTPFEYNEEIITITEDNIPALKSEAFSGNLNNYRAKLSMEISALLNANKVLIKSYSSSWEKVAKRVFESEDFGGQISKSNFYKTDLENATKEATNALEKIAIAQQLVKSKVKWNGNRGFYAQNGIKNAYKNGEGNVGDINLLLTSMLRSLDINANPVLVSTRSNGIPLFPTRKGFNYVICLAQVDGKQILLDASEKYSNNGILPERALNWQGRVVQKDGTSKAIDLIPITNASESTMLNLKIEDDLSLTGKVRQSQTSYLALRHRKKYNDLDEESMLKSYEENKGDIEISDFEYKNQEDATKPTLVSYNFEILDGVDQIGDKLYFSPLFFFKTKENPFKLKERQYPIDFVFPIQDKYIINIMLPKGYKVETLPKSEAFAFNGNQAKFTYIAKVNGNYLTLNLQLQINQYVIAASDYEIFKSFFAKYVEKQAEQVVLAKL